MKIVMFYHSLVSCWNHGNAHFLRGVVRELQSRGHRVRVLEPADGWSAANLRAERGEAPFAEFRNRFPGLESERYHEDSLDLDRALDGADLVIVHEWSSHSLVARLGRHRRNAGYRLLFHDTHHRAVTEPDSMAAYDLRDYDGVLAFGQVIRDLYLERGWAQRAWTWHEAADVRLFRPPPEREPGRDLIWVGNWGDEERTAELHEMLLEPIRDLGRELGLSATIHGVRYPERAVAEIDRVGATYGGWLPNHRVPEAFAGHRVTVHVPRRPYVQALPGIPTIRPFEAMACGIPLISSPWHDSEGLFTAGEDYLVARNGAEMKRQLRAVLGDPELARTLAARGWQTISERHTCGHRVDELVEIHQQLQSAAADSVRSLERKGA